MGIKEFTKLISPEGEDRLRVRIKAEKGKVTDLTVQYEAMFGERWHEVIRYDCAHGFFHRDILHPTGEKTKYQIPILNLNDALLYAEQDIKDRWKWYKDRFKKEIKGK